MVVKFGLPKRRPNDFSDILDYVKQIVEYVRKEGDNAIIELTKKIDGVEIDRIEVSMEELEYYAGNISKDVEWAINLIIKQLEAYNELVKPPNIGGERSGIEFGVF